MPYETGLLVGGISIATACVAKLKFLVKKMVFGMLLQCKVAVLYAFQ